MEDQESDQFVCPECGEASEYDEAFPDDVSEATGWAVCPHCGHVDVGDI